MAPENGNSKDSKCISFFRWLWGCLTLSNLANFATALGIIGLICQLHQVSVQERNRISIDAINSVYSLDFVKAYSKILDAKNRNKLDNLPLVELDSINFALQTFNRLGLFCRYGLLEPDILKASLASKPEVISNLVDEINKTCDQKIEKDFLTELIKGSK